MKELSKLNLSDLISALKYLDEYSDKLENFIIEMEKLCKERQERWDDGKNIIKHLESSRINAKKIRNEINKRLFTKAEINAVVKAKERKTENELIEYYINLALKIKDVPTGKKYLKKPNLYSRLNDKLFLFNLRRKIEDKLKSKYNYSFDKIEILKDLESYINQKLEAVLRKDGKLKKQIPTKEYKPGMENKRTDVKKRKFSVDY